MKIDVEFKEEKQTFTVDFGEIQKVNTEEIPREYGLITYDQNKNITVS